MKIIDQPLLQELGREAVASPRLRTHHNLHQSMEEPVHRLLVAMEPGTYVPPHRHHEPPRWELFVILSGKAALLTFDQQGKVCERIEIEAGAQKLAAEIPPGLWHTVVPLQAATVLFEFKEGPYLKPTDKHFAPWAPQEGDPRCSSFLQWLSAAQPGDRLPDL